MLALRTNPIPPCWSPWNEKKSGDEQAPRMHVPHSLLQLGNLGEFIQLDPAAETGQEEVRKARQMDLQNGG